MSKVWTEFNSKSISHLNLNCMAIKGILHKNIRRNSTVTREHELFCFGF